MKKIITLCFLMALMCVKGWGQAASASWTLTSTTTPTVTGNLTATAPTFGSGLLNTGTNNANYGIYANNWTSGSTAPVPSSNTKYFQFSVSPTGSNTLNITSLTLGYYNNEPNLNDGLAIFYSTNSTFATSTQVVANSSQINANSGSYTNSGIAATVASGQTLYVRIYYYFVSSSSIYFGARTLALSGTTTSTGPTLTANPTTLNFGSSCLNTSPTVQTTTVTGSNLTGTFTVGGLTGYTYSTSSGGTYSSTLPLTPVSGSINQAIYVKFTPTAAQTYNGNIPISGGSATTINVAVTGTGVNSPPTVTSGTASSITYNSATVSGGLTAGCSTTSAYGIEYSTTNGFANGSGTQVPSSNLSSGAFSSNLTGLAASTTYFFHAYGTNSGGTSYGVQGNFTTAALTYIDSWISMSTGSTNWCAGETRTISVTVQNSGTATWTSGSTGVNLSYYWSNQSRDFNNRLLPFTGLGPGQQQTITFPVTATSAGTYTLNFDLVKEGSCWFGDNASGCSGPGNVVYVSPSQTIGALPAVATAAATSVTTNSATVPGTITTGCTAITGYGVEYSTTNNFANGTGTAVAGSNLSGSNYTVNLTGLSQGTTYYYHTFVNYSGGSSYSAQGSFVTLTPTLSASALAAFGNVCTGATAGPNPFTITGSNLTVVNIAVGPLAGYTFSTSATGTYSASLSLTHPAGSYSQAIYVKFTPTAVQSYSGNIPVSGGGATTINVAASGSGVNSPPTVAAGTAGSITAASATISGSTISSIGCSSVTAYGIEYSTTNNFTVGTGTRVAGTGFSGSSGGTFTTTLSGLSANTSYYYRAYATNSGGTSYSSTQGSFSTLCATVTSFPFTETFETSSATSNCWSNVYVSGSQNWGYITGSYGGDVSSAHTGSYDASFNDEGYTTAVTKLVSPVLNLSGLTATGARVRFWYQNPATNYLFFGYHDQLKVYYRTTSTGAWTLIPNALYKDDIYNWVQVSLILPSISSTYQIAFEGSVDPDNAFWIQSGDLAIDDITIEATPPPPANDNCSGAVALTVNSTCSAISGTTVNATLSQAAATCSGSTGVADDDVWYKFIANNTTASVAVSTVSSTLDPVIQAFSGTCGSLASITCIDASGNGSGETLILSGLSVGATYYVRVYGYGSDISTQGTFNICITGTCLAPAAYSVTGGGAYCTGGTGVAVGLSNSQTGYSYQLRLNGVATGSAVAGTGSALSFGNQTAAGTYTVVATNTGSSGCSTTMTGSATVSINPNATITLTSAASTTSQSPCINTAITPITYTIGGGGSGAGVVFSPAISGVTGSLSGTTFTISGTPTVSGTFNYTVTTTGTCTQTSASGTITVKPNATIILTSAAATTSQSPCINTAITPITYTISGGATSASASGLPTGVSGTLSGTTLTISGIPSVSGPFAYTVTTTGTCTQTSAMGTLTVNPNASAGTVSGTSPLCIGATATYTASSVVLGGSGTGAWSSSNTAVATVNPVTGVVTAIGSGTADIIYTVTGGCGGTASAQQTLTVSPNANAGTVSGTTPLCSGSTATYTSNGDAGGAWSSTNTNVATVDPSAGIVTTVNAGTTDITYTVNTGCNAPVSALKTLTVTASPSAAISYTGAPFCTSAGPGSPTISGTTGGTFSSTTGLSITPAGVITPSGSTPGTYTVTYTVAASGGCAVYTATTSVTINALPVATVAAANSPVCAGSGGSFTITGTPGSTVSYNLSSGSSSSKLLDGSGTATVPAGFISGSITITLTNVSASSSTGGCTSTPAGAGSTATITTTPLPVAENLTGGGNYCQGGTGVPVGLSSSESGVSYQLLVDDGTTTSPVGSPVAGTGGVISFGNQTTTGTYSVQATNTTTGCVRTGGGTTVMVGQYTQAQITADAAPATQTVCQNGTPADLTVTAVGNNLVYQWYSNTTSTTTGGTPVETTPNSSSYTPVTTAPGTLYYYVTVTGPCRTVTSRIDTVTVNALPDASISPDHHICTGEGSGVVISSISGGTVYYHINNSTTALSVSVPVNSGVTLTDVPAANTTYTLDSVKSGVGCVTFLNAASTVTLDTAPTIVVTGTPDQSVCKNNNIISVTYTASGSATSLSVINAGNLTVTNNNTSVVTVSGIATTAITYSVTTVSSSVCSPYTITGTITLLPVSWTGNIDNDWNTAGNWCSNSVPTSSDDVTIGTVNPRPVLSADANVHDLEIQGGYTVTLSGHTLNVTGSITGSGTITGSSSSNLIIGATNTVKFTTGLDILHNLMVNGGTLTLGTTLSIAPGSATDPSVVTVAGGAHLTTNDGLTLKSDADGTASIGEGAAAGSYITGAVTSERYTDAGKGTPGRRAWRLMTSPVSQPIYDAWQESGSTTITGFGTQITGEGFANANAAAMHGYDYIGGGNHTSIKHYTGGAWVPLDADADTKTTGVRAEQAYMLFVRGDRTVGSPQPTAHNYTDLRAKGSLVQGDQPISLTPNSTFTLVGNPYASTIDFSKIYNSNTTISNQFYLWNSKYGSYGAYVLVAPGSTGYVATPDPLTTTVGQLQGAYQYIPSGSGFFVFPNSVGNNPGSFTIHEADKAAGSVPPINPFRVVAATNIKQLVVNLNQKNSDTSATLADGFRAKFSDDYTGNEEDNSSIKAWNFNENLNLVRNGKSHIIEAHSDVQKTDTLFMQMWYVTKRSYQLQMRADNFTAAPGIQAWLIDNYSGTKQEISLSGNVVSFDFAVTSDSLSWKSDRFMIVFQNNSAVLPVTLTNVKAILQNGGVTVSWTVSNEVNMKGYTVERSTDGGRTYTAVATQAAKNITGAIVTSYAAFDAQPETGDNLYRIRIEAKDGGVAYSGVVSVSIGATGNIEIAVYPNPVREGKVNLQMTNLAAGTYLVSVYSEGGQPVYQKKITISQPSTTQSEELRLGKGLAQGSYQLRIADSQGSLVKETRLIIGR